MGNALTDITQMEEGQQFNAKEDVKKCADRTVFFDEEAVTTTQSRVYEDGKLKVEKNYSKRKKLSKHAIIGIFSGVILAAVVIALIVTSNNRLNPTEQYAYNVVRDYQRYLKNPDSLLLRGTVVVIESEGDRYTFFTESASNSFGAMVTSVPVYKNYQYLGDYDDGETKTAEEWLDMSKTEQDNYMALLQARLLLATRNLHYAYDGPPKSGIYEDSDGNIYHEIDGKKIAKKIGCTYVDN